MLKLFKDLNIWASVILCCSQSAIARDVVDATKTKVHLGDQPRRVVSLAPSLSELAADILGDQLDRLVGVCEFSDYPSRLKLLPSVGPYHQFNLEKIVSLKPDLVLATTDGNPSDKIHYLRELGLPVVVVASGNFSEIEDSINLVSQALGSPELGKSMAVRLRRGIERFRQTSQGNRKLRVMLQVGDSPLVVVGKQSFLHSALETIGATNVYADSHDHYPRPSIEDVVSRNPDVVIVLALGENIESYQEMAKKWDQFPKMKAALQHRVYVLKSDALLRPTFRFLEGLSLLSKTLYGKE